MITWLSSKISVLLFAIMAFSAFIGLVVFLRGFSALDNGARDAYSLARVIDSACSSQGVFNATLNFSSSRQVAAWQRGVYYFVNVSGVARQVHCPLLPVSFSARQVKIGKAGNQIALASGG